MTTDPPPPPASLVLTGECRRLRRVLTPVAWMVLEEVALDSVETAHGRVAATSARRIAEQLGLDPGTAARALRVLRDRGLVDLIRPAGVGRFAESRYRLSEIAGVNVADTGVHRPHVADAHVATIEEDQSAAPRSSRGAVPSGRRSRRDGSSGAQAELALVLEEDA